MDSFSENLVSNISPESWTKYVDKDFETFFEELSTEEKIKYLSSKGKLPLQECVQEMPMSVLKNLEKSLLPPGGRSEYSLINDITENFFLMREHSTRIRENEKAFLNDFDTEQLWLNLCDIEIPKHLAERIFHFLPRNYSTLFRIGTVCKDFYAILLSSWKFVRITRKNIKKISLLVLRNVEAIALEETPVSFSTSDLMYLLDQFNPSKLETLRMDCGTDTFVEILNMAENRKKKFGLPNPFENVRKIVFEKDKIKKDVRSRPSILRSKSKQMALVFPSVRIIHSPPRFELIQHCSNLEILSFSTVFYKKDWYGELYLDSPKSQSYQKVLSVNKQMKFLPKTLRKVSMRLDSSILMNSKLMETVNNRILKAYVKNFKKLEILNVHLKYNHLGNLNRETSWKVPESEKFKEFHFHYSIEEESIHLKLRKFDSD